MRKNLLILIIFFLFTLIICGTASADPDLVVTSVNATNNVSPGSTITVNDTVTNKGNETANGFYVGYYLQDEYAVVKKPANQITAAIYQDKVVWPDYRYDRADSDLYYKNITGTENGYISSLNGNQTNPAIYGDIIVWQDDTFGHWQIMGYKIPNRDDPIAPDIYILYNSTYDQINPAIYNDKIVWQQYNKTTGNWDIYLYDFSVSDDVAMAKGKETVQITKDGADHENPCIDGNYIVWQQKSGTGVWNIYTYDLSTGDITHVCPSSENQENASIYGDNVVWQQRKANGNYDIYMYDLSAGIETQITNNTANQTNPAIYGDKIVWQDNRNGNWDIYMYDLTLGMERPLTVNTGNQTDPAIYDNKVVWTDNRNGNDDIYMTDSIALAPEYTRYVSNLAANESNSALTNITLPYDLKADVNYYIIAMADAAYGENVGNSVSESDENNNIKFSAPMIVPDVDLTIPSISIPITSQSGGSIIIVNAVQNNGTKNSNPFYIKFYLSSDGTTLDTYLGSRYISGGLKAGASNTAYTNLTIPSNILGSYYIIAVIDPANNACETNKLNNIGTSLTTINITAPDLIATSISTNSTSYQKGAQITIKDTVKNQGKAAANGFYVKYYLSKDSNITTSDTYLGSRYVSGLKTGESSTASENFALPSNLVGSYYIGAIVDSSNNVSELYESNNIKVGSTTINIIAPDLVAKSISTSSIVYYKGKKITIQNTVKNQGTAAAAGFYVKYYLSTSKTSTSSVYIGQRYVSSLKSGASSAASTSLTLSSTVKKGTYYIKMVIYPVNSSMESDISNNVIYSGTKVYII